jgi:two-component system sensor histidine kinase/response regulator
MGYSILVVDDHADNIRTINALLQEMGLGKKVYSAPNGRIALELAHMYLPDLILSDWEMPEMDGLELVKALKASEATRNIPVIMITAVKTDPVSMKESFDAGVHDYLQKPFNNLAFFARVGATLRIASQSHLIAQQHAELQKMNHLKDRMLAAISHDVRSPLVSLDGILRLFQTEGIELGKTELLQYTGIIHEELNEVLSLMDSLLFWAKTQLQDEKIRTTSFDIGDTTREIVQLFNKKLAQKGIQIYQEIPKGMRVHSSKHVISFILRNLIDNAVKFTPEGGEIRVSFQVEDNHARLQVRDTGKGMDVKVLNDFFSGKEISSTVGTSGETGTGLGLNLCKDFAIQLGASISVNSILGAGSTFQLDFPMDEILNNL